jgi:hypothetical protein
LEEHRTQDFCETPSSIADLAANTALLLSNEEASPFYYNSSDPDNAPKRTGAAHCTYKAHISCRNPDSTYQEKIQKCRWTEMMLVIFRNLKTMTRKWPF